MSQDKLPHSISIQAPDRETTFVQLTNDTIIIGSTDSADITLDSTRVSDQHARIDRQSSGSYTITDLGSSNKTFVNGVALLADVPELLTPTQLVSIGEFRLRLQLAADLDTTGPQIAQPGMQDVESDDVITAAETQVGSYGQDQSTLAEKIKIQIVPAAITVEPGSQATAQLMLTNRMNTVKHFVAEIQDISDEWISLPATPLQLMPGANGTIPITFHPPEEYMSTAGDHQFTVRVTPEPYGEELAHVDAILTIRPFQRFKTDIMPARVTQGKVINFTVENSGNAPERVTVIPRDRAAMLLFEPPTAIVDVQPGQKQAIQFRANVEGRHITGVSKTFPFELQATNLSGNERVQSGELVSNPLIPTWLAGILTLVCMGTIALIVLLLGGVFGGDDNDNSASLPADIDGDGILDADDNCPDVPNPDQWDGNSDRIGDLCDIIIRDVGVDSPNQDVLEVGDAHGFRINGEANQKIAIVVYSDTTKSDSFDTFLQLFDSDGNHVSDSNDSNFALNSFLIFTPSESQQYTVRVTGEDIGYDPIPQGGYLFSAGEVIVMGDIVDGHLDDSSDQRTFYFYGTPNEIDSNRIRALIDVFAPNYFATVDLYGPDGNLIVSAVADRYSSTREIDKVLPSYKWYFVRITTNNNDVGGSFTIKVEACCG